MLKSCLFVAARLFSNDGYILTISAFQKFRRQIQFFHVVEPLTDLLVQTDQ